MSDAPARRAHAHRDVAVRERKALKIERLLGVPDEGPPLRLLDFGAGSGVIAAHFGAHPSGRFQVDAVDVVDSRVVHEGYRYTAIEGGALPFPAQTFDVVVSNHVIEHVGGRADQRRYLGELARVLKAGGVAYFGCPSRWAVMEPHYRVRFLTWLPVAWRSPYLRWRGRAANYDCTPHGPLEIRRELRAAGFRLEDMTVDAWWTTWEIERPDSAWLPLLRRAAFRRAMRPFAVLSPIQVFRLARA